MHETMSFTGRGVRPELDSAASWSQSGERLAGATGDASTGADQQAMPATGGPVRGAAAPAPAAARPALAGGVSPTRRGDDDPVELLSHELRTPITSIHLGARVLRLRDQERSSIEAAAVDAVEAEANRLFLLVEDLLAVARHEDGREPLPVEPVMLQHMLPSMLAAEAEAHPGTPIRVHLPHDLPPVSADEAALRHVLRNVLGNAVRFAPTRSPVEVVASRTGDGGVELRIADRGAGIDAAEAEALFEPFYRSDRTASVPGGAGLGLAAARRLLEAMGGTIRALPRDGGGAVFAIRFSGTAEPAGDAP